MDLVAVGMLVEEELELAGPVEVGSVHRDAALVRDEARDLGVSGGDAEEDDADQGGGFGKEVAFHDGRRFG